LRKVYFKLSEKSAPFFKASWTVFAIPLFEESPKLISEGQLRVVTVTFE
jgi:hypothetical protein